MLRVHVACKDPVGALGVHSGNVSWIRRYPMIVRKNRSFITNILVLQLRNWEAFVGAPLAWDMGSRICRESLRQSTIDGYLDP